MTETLQKILGKDTTLIEIPPENFTEKTVEITKLMAEEDTTSIILVNTPSKTFIKKLGENTEINIIDTITKTQKRDTKNTENVKYVENPSSLTEISIELDRELKKGTKILILDSLNSMLIHSEEHTVKKFIHSLLTKTRIGEAKAILLVPEGQLPENVRADIAQLCDQTIKY